MKNLMKTFRSWKTTISGVIAGLVVILLQIQAIIDSDPATVFSMEAFAIGLGLLGVGAFAKDGDKSTEDVSDG